jgi:uncharacterized membrane protein YfcA
MSSDLVLLVVGAVIAGFVQGVSGFAFGMVAMSFWVWGFEPRLASVLVVFGALIGQMTAVVSVKRSLRLDSLAPYLAGGMIGIPIGVLVLPYLNPNVFKLVLGFVLSVCCPIMLLSRQLPRITSGGRVADGVAGAAGGFMGGIGGITGAIPTLWCALRGLEKEHQRAIIQNFNLVTLSVTMAAYVATGLVTRDMLPLLPVVAIALVVPAMLGARVYAGLGQEGFRKIVLGLLSLSGLAMLSASIAKMLA